MAHPYEIVTLAQVKTHLDMGANTDYDTILQGFIDAITDKFENYTNRFIKQRTGIVQYDNGNGKGTLMLDQWPAEKPTEVWVDSTSQFTDATKQLAVTDYELELSANGTGIGIILINNDTHCRFPAGRRNIKIVYNGGYVTVPYDIQNAALWTASFMYETRSDRAINVESKGKNQETTRYLMNLPPLVLDVLETYKRVEWPTGNIQTGAL